MRLTTPFNALRNATSDIWRDQYINLIRKRKKLPALEKKTRSYKMKRESIIDNLANEFDRHLNLASFLN